MTEWKPITIDTKFGLWHILGCGHTCSTWMHESCPTAKLALAMGWTHHMKVNRPGEKKDADHQT